MNSVRLHSLLRDITRVGFCQLPVATGQGSYVKYTKLDMPYKKFMGHTTDRTLLAALSGSQNRYISPGLVSSHQQSANIFPLKDQLRRRNIFFSSTACSIPGNRSFWSNASSKQSDVHDRISTAASRGDAEINNSINSGNEWTELLNQAYHSVRDALEVTGKMAKEVSNEVTPYINQMIDSQPFLKDFIVPIGGALTASVLAWMVMPRLLRKLYKYSYRSPLPLLLGSSSQEQIPYEKSMWSALEDPARYLVTFLAFSQLAAVIVPSASPYLSQAWRGAVVLSFVWFLHRWKENVFSRALSREAMNVTDREKLLALDKISSVGLLVLGAMGFAEACGVAVQSILTVGGIGGVATAFAAKDILGNVLNGLSLQFSKPFSIGDTIKAGSIEGQVVEIGLTMTCLLNAEKFPVMVPNSLFSSQVIVNKSRAEYRAIVSKIPICVNDVEKIPLVSEDVKSMLRAYPKVFMGKEAPYCFISRVENSYAELTIGCNLIRMRKDELYATQQDILLEAVKVIKKHGAELGSTLCDPNCR